MQRTNHARFKFKQGQQSGMQIINSALEMSIPVPFVVSIQQNDECMLLLPQPSETSRFHHNCYQVLCQLSVGNLPTQVHLATKDEPKRQKISQITETAGTNFNGRSI